MDLMKASALDKIDQGLSGQVLQVLGLKSKRTALKKWLDSLFNHVYYEFHRMRRGFYLLCYTVTFSSVKSQQASCMALVL
jgi:hypothetical protein